MTGLSPSQTTWLIHGYQQGREVQLRVYRLPTRPGAVRPRRRSCSAPITTSARSASRSWRNSQRRSCTGCARAVRIAPYAGVSAHPAHLVALGERRRPAPQNHPGYVRLDTVRPRRSRKFGCCWCWKPCWRSPLSHSRLSFRQGSQFIKHTVAVLLNKLLAEQIMSRPLQQRQRTGRIKKRLDDSQTHRLRPHCFNACRSLRPLLPPALQPVS